MFEPIRRERRAVNLVQKADTRRRALELQPEHPQQRVLAVHHDQRGSGRLRQDGNVRGVHAGSRLRVQHLPRRHHPLHHRAHPGLLITGRSLQGVSSAGFALAYIVLNENLQARVFGTSVGIIAAINGGVGGYVGQLMAQPLGFRSMFAVVLVLTAIAATCIIEITTRGIQPVTVRAR
ncbi:hypothetical protein [Pseudarthrobacter sp. S6]|uniref:hypothetical protein n=1 Tax=Pseudarthrobacter sp. S6 TaxID=3418420 RepID=UPI00347E66A6